MLNLYNFHTLLTDSSTIFLTFYLSNDVLYFIDVFQLAFTRIIYNIHCSHNTRDITFRKLSSLLRNEPKDLSNSVSRFYFFKKKKKTITFLAPYTKPNVCNFC